MTEHEDEISDAILDWEDANNVELDDDDFDALGQHVAALAEQTGSIDVDGAYAAATSGPDDDHDGGYEPEQGTLREDAQREFARLENKLGRQLTQREVGAVSAGIAEQSTRWDDIDAQRAFDDHYEQKREQPPDLDNPQDRRAWMAERLQDARAANTPDDDSAREYDLDDKKDRQAYMLARYQGTESEDAPADDAA